MALTEATVIDRIEINEQGAISVRRATFILRDGERLPSPSYHRVSYEPGADLNQEDERVQKIAAVLWTPDMVAAAQARRESALAAVTGVPPSLTP